MGRKRLTKKQLRNNMIECGLMLGICIIVLILGVHLIKTWTGGKETAGRTAEESSQQVISIPEISKEETSAPTDGSSGAETSSVQESSAEESSGVAASSSIEESSVEESSVEESSAEESSVEESSAEESSIEESSVSDGKWMTVTDEYFSDAVFIGNSLTEGLFWYTDMEDITDGYYSTGLNVLDAQDDAFWEDTYTLRDVLSWETYNKVYVMMGLNEVGWTYVSDFIEEYEAMIHIIESCCPGATIYVQSILPVSAYRSAEGDSVNNDNINRYNVEIQAMAERNGWTYLHVWDAIANSDGVLDADATPDGIHFGTYYMELWIDYLKTHALAE